jgi:hypothetical protein
MHSPGGNEPVEIAFAPAYVLLKKAVNKSWP